MEVLNLFNLLKNNAYPGRGIVLGRSADNAKAVIAYFIMGRSVNSRNRIFTVTEDGIRTEAHDPSKMVDPSLIIYHPVRSYEGKTIVTNGDQTDTIYEGLDRQMTFEQSLRSREFEPDAPNYTPRISGVLHVEAGKYNFAMSILKSDDGDPSSCLRQTFAYESPAAGQGRFISTYQGDGNPLPSFAGEPVKLAFDDSFTADIDTFAGRIWDALNEDNKVSLFVRFIDIATGEAESRIINKNK
jgi:IMP cyclohydrolase